MNSEDSVLREISQTQRDKSCVFSHMRSKSFDLQKDNIAKAQSLWKRDVLVKRVKYWSCQMNKL